MSYNTWYTIGEVLWLIFELSNNVIAFQSIPYNSHELSGGLIIKSGHFLVKALD